ncbi:HTH-type transcriptional regulator AdhR [Lactobacillus helveticus]|uniref:HTH-type transcriptional regulator AdhR n=1 Tax=Lactobacillus helveticus TaxID=1587 RepID=A0A3Q8SNT1_LACHE|nr:HTH-type transcriptional regulator AdhR [Lactobacillus helveticus]
MTDLTITDVSEKYHLKPDTLRYYERIGLIPAVPRKKNGNRYYNEGLQKWVDRNDCLSAAFWNYRRSIGRLG